MAGKTHSTYTVYKRIANLILILIGVAISANLWWMNNTQSAQWYEVQAQQLGRSLSYQKALELAEPVREKDNNAIQLALTQLLADQYVIGASVFDFRGRQLASIGNVQSFLAQEKPAGPERFTFVSDIVATIDGEQGDDVIANQVLGYVSIQLDSQTVMAHHDQYQQQLNQQRIVFMFLAAMGALYVTRAFYKIRFRLHRQLRAKQRLGKQT